MDSPDTEVVEAVPASPQDLLHLGRERARHGDYEGARLLAAQAMAQPGDHVPEARYLSALSLEFEGRWEEALAAYDALMQDTPTDDTRFRRAECLGKLGRVDEARDQISEIGQTRRLGDADRVKIGVLKAVWDLELGKESKAIRSLGKLLSTAGAEALYYQAMARTTLAERALEEADAIAFVGSDRDKEAAFSVRTQLLAVAEEHVVSTLRLGEVSFSLRGILRLGESYADLGQDLLAESPIERLTPEQLALNRSMLEDRVEQVWVKGTLCFDRGLELAARDHWTAEPVPTLRARREELVARVDRLAAGEP